MNQRISEPANKRINESMNQPINESMNQQVSSFDYTIDLYENWTPCFTQKCQHPKLPASRGVGK
jgi:hypothetical protein